MTKKMLAPVASDTRPRQSSTKASSKPAASAACLDSVPIMYNPAALLAVGAVSGCGRFHGAMPSRTPFMRSAPNRFGQAQQAMARWILVCWADTDNCSVPRQAIGRT